MTLSITLTLVGSAAAMVAALLLVVHYGAGQRPITSLVQSYGVELKEIERKSREGLLGEIDADAARSAVLRTLIAAMRARESRWWLLRGDRSALVIAGLAAVSVAALGAPSAVDTDGGLAATRSPALGLSNDPDVARLAVYARSVLPRSALGHDAGAEQALPDVETMVERLAARLEKAPDDAEGWRMLGWSRFHTQQPRKAAEAYERALALRPKSGDLMVAYAEALVAAEAGTVSPKAIDIFNAALQIDSSNAKTRYFLALAKEQAGQKKEALDEWLSLLGASIEEEPWTAELRLNTTRLASELGVEMVQVGKTGPSGDTADTGARRKQPMSEDIQHIEALPPDQRQSLIRGMVDGLASRLKASPRDEEGWMMLIRSRVVLGEELIARDALRKALAVFADDKATRSRIRAAARGLGLSGN